MIFPADTLYRSGIFIDLEKPFGSVTHYLFVATWIILCPSWNRSLSWTRIIHYWLYYIPVMTPVWERVRWCFRSYRMGESGKAIETVYFRFRPSLFMTYYRNVRFNMLALGYRCTYSDRWKRFSLIQKLRIC